MGDQILQMLLNFAVYFWILTKANCNLKYSQVNTSQRTANKDTAAVNDRIMNVQQSFHKL